ncbi:hypothetical protein MOC16_gp209 [Klebsiella phage vB_KpM_FBKp24]|uniref:Uncharacterized protein n=1 Tax=Klebsiella phage vB_KpM_FBKp24 TaxID=2801834 RepID=A0A7U0GBP7_9CAUD|nr:hypothetical protein MOC16_gp209 [Klebsiella phage vB_KpM_FBKp24]QQV92211.1 hypothetical protein vBKpMFBKp24_204 [Klebsiella phage vB_KpM_FBKp24]
MKPIEAGCLALVISDPEHLDNVGKVVRVVELIPKNEKIHIFFLNHDQKIRGTGDTTETLWLLEGELSTTAILSFNTDEGVRTISPKVIHYESLCGNKGNHLLASNRLMRIDDFSEKDKQKDREQEIGRGLLTPVGLVEWESYGIYP